MMTEQPHIVIFVGVCGSGKSTIARKIAQTLEVPFFDADTLSDSPSKNGGVAAGAPEIAGWLAYVASYINVESTRKGSIISCSILKRQHRKTLAASVSHDIDWVFMDDALENVVHRMDKHARLERPVTDLKSDFEALESPKRALTVDMRKTEAQIIATVLRYLSRKYG